jgi:hypothetical protein
LSSVLAEPAVAENVAQVSRRRQMRMKDSGARLTVQFREACLARGTSLRRAENILDPKHAY